jgi:hypothetical protein
VIRYMAQLPFRMAKAAVLVPAGDLDGALCISSAARYMEQFCEAFSAAHGTPGEDSDS